VSEPRVAQHLSPQLHLVAVFEALRGRTPDEIADVIGVRDQPPSARQPAAARRAPHPAPLREELAGRVVDDDLPEKRGTGAAAGQWYRLVFVPPVSLSVVISVAISFSE
jgi:hypothetical protein